MDNIFPQYKKDVLEEVARAQKLVEDELQTRVYISKDEYLFFEIRKSLNSIVADMYGCEMQCDLLRIQEPPAHIKGDFAIEIFNLAKQVKENPALVAKKIAERINEGDFKFLSHTETVGPFINLVLNRQFSYTSVLSGFHKFKDKYGESDLNAGKKAIIDYSSPNIAKPIGVGHLRSTIIGQALVNIYKKTGFSVLSDNHLGDWGTQFGQLVYAYKEWGDEKKINADPIRELKNLYVEFNRTVKEHEDIAVEARNIFKKLEEKDDEYLVLWKKFRDLSLKDFNKVYNRLGIKFDTYIGESYFVDDAEEIIDDCLNKKICNRDINSKMVYAECKDIPSFLLRKQDGSSLYITRDIATLKFRIEKFDPDSVLYVVGDEQALNFKQLFRICRELEYLPKKVHVEHISFGMILREGKKMSTRKGTIIELEDLLKNAVKKSARILSEKNNNLDEKDIEEISEKIGVGAIIYNDLRQSKEKEISFDWEKMLDFNAGSAVYLQYACVRINSILKKIPASGFEIEKCSFEDETEFFLVKKIMLYPMVIAASQEKNAPHLVALYLEEVAQAFNIFYSRVQIINSLNKELLYSRISLLKATGHVLVNGLGLLNIQVPEKM